MIKILVLILVCVFGNEAISVSECETIEELAYKYANDPKGLYEWVHENIRYSTENDIKQSPKVTLDRGYGDCEDFAILYNHILRRGQINSAIVCIDYDGRKDHFICVFYQHFDIWYISNNDIFMHTRFKQLSELKQMFPDAKDLYIYEETH